jgi:UDP-GlcNAc3NAcA epimerase
LKVVSVVGARPQFIKAAPVGRALRARGLTEVLVHTGQHYDHNMSALFFQELDIPEPHFNLGVGSGLHGWQTGQMLTRIEEVLLEERPDWVLVYGDTNSTLAGALAAVKLHVPVAHVEAGLRSFNRGMPEEHNRVLTDHAADLLFCPTQTAVDHLAAEGVTRGVHLTGDVMYDAVLYNSDLAEARSDVLGRLDLAPENYMLATVHRPQNTDDPGALSAILVALGELERTVVLPAHPRMQAALERYGFEAPDNVRLINAVGYLDMLVLEKHARLILTDSGGVQKEAYFFAVPCVTLREETEWVETVAAGWNVLVGADPARIVAVARELAPPGEQAVIIRQMRAAVFGDGQASERIVEILNHSR